MKKLMMLIVAGLFSAGAAFANEDIKFNELDTDGDGQLSRTEVAQNSELAAQFSTIDADGDGYLNDSEVQNASMEETDMEMQETGAEEDAGAQEDY